MYHSINFIDIHDDTKRKNTWTDWHLIPASRPVINPPKVNKKIVDVPGHNGGIDLTDAVLGSPTFGNRTGSIDFYVANDYWRWEIAFTTIMMAIHGRELKLKLEDDPAYYYSGRFSVNKWSSEKVNSKISIDYDIFPFKQSIQEYGDDWLWDPFNFETGIITIDNGVISAGETLVIDGPYSVNPVKFTPGENSEITIVYTNGSTTITHELEEGDNIFDDVFLRYGINNIEVHGTGNVHIMYRGGVL